MGLVFPFNNEEDRKEFIKRLAPDLSDISIAALMQNGFAEHQPCGQTGFIKDANGLDDKALEIRLQAVKLFPFLKGNSHSSQSEKVKKLYETIDSGKPIFEAMLPFLHSGVNTAFQPGHIRRMAKLGVAHYQDVSILNDYAKNMDINFFPQTPSEYKIACRFYTNLCLAFEAKMYGSRMHSSHQDSASLAFDALMEKLAKGFKASDYKGIRDASTKNDFSNIRDTVAWVSNQLLNMKAEEALNGDNNQAVEHGPVSHYAMMDKRGITMKLMMSLSPTDIAQLNVALHSNWARISRTLKDYDEKEKRELVQKWETLYPAADSKNLPELGEFKIVPLTSRAQLNHEHEVLGEICIDGYAPQCIKGTSFCFSIRDKFGMSLSVFELDEHGRFVQHEAFEGSEPEQAQKDACAAYLKAVHNGVLTSNPLYEAWRKKAEGFTFVDVYGYDQYDPDRAKLAMDLLLDIESLPKRFKTALQDYLKERTLPAAPEPRSQAG